MDNSNGRLMAFVTSVSRMRRRLTLHRQNLSPKRARLMRYNEVSSGCSGVCVEAWKCTFVTVKPFMGLGSKHSHKLNVLRNLDGFDVLSSIIARQA